MIVTVGPSHSVASAVSAGARMPLLLALVLSTFRMPAVAAGGQSAILQEARQYESQTITDIQFQPADQPLTRDELNKRLPFQAGSRFHERDLRQAIQNLFATGRFSDLAVDASEVRGGVALRFLTKPAYFVGRIVVRGVSAPPNSAELATATKLRLGRPFSDTDRVQALQSLTSLLRQNGFYHAKVGAHVEYRSHFEEANLTFDVDTGKRARFERPQITGTPGIPDQTIMRVTHWKRLYGLLGWQDLTAARLRQGLENIRNYYEKRNLLDSRVTLTHLGYHADTNTAQPTINLQTGARLILKTTGAKISQHELRQLVPVFEEHSVDEDLLIEGEHNIEQYLVSEGYFGARVSYRATRAASSSEGTIAAERTITYDIDRGSRHKFVYLGITGNRYFPSETIRERLYLQPAEFPRFPYGRYGAVYLRQDIQSIQNLYTSNGFRDARVTAKTQDDYRGTKDHLAVFIHIQEGRQWFVSKLSIEGPDPADLPALRSTLASLEGQPFSEANVAEDRESFLNYYYNQGYLNAAFEFYVDPANQPNRVDVRYVIRPGPRKYVREVLVSGLETTRPSLVYDRIELKEKQPLSLAEETDSQRRLYELGIFARVNTALQDPDGEEDNKTVLYDLDEARHYSVNVGVGAQIARIGGGVTTLDNPAGTTGFAPRLAFGITRINVLGLGQTVGLQTAVSTIEQRGTLTYFFPQLLTSDKLNLTLTGLLESSSDIRTFTAHRREASIQLGQRLSRAYSLQYRLVFRNVTLSNLKIDQLLVPLLSQPETVGMGEFSIIEDKRDDPTDAHRGIYTTLDVSYAPAVLGSQTQFARGLFRNSTYHPFHRDIVFARSTQFGIISRTGGRANIPLAERLYSGGSTSIRAFPDFQAGPRDLATGFPLGGNALFTNNLELRFPLYGDNLAGVLFEDAGNVYQTLSDFSLRFRQRNLQDFNYTVQSAGFGLRYRTPIGPIRLDFSFSPDAPRFFGLKGTEQDYLNGTAVPAVQKINAFQFHFSLGQAF